MNTRWYLVPPEPGYPRFFGVVVEELEEPRRGLLAWVMSRKEARVALHQLRAALPERLARADRPLKTFDPEESP